MTRDDRQVALNEVRGQLLALAEYYSYARDELDPTAAAFSADRGARCEAQARQLAEAIRAMGGPPAREKPDSYLFHELAETVMVSLVGGRREAHMRERLDEERSLVRYVDQALGLKDMPVAARRILSSIRAGAGDAEQRLLAFVRGEA